jgi:hypothetical protein
MDKEYVREVIEQWLESAGQTAQLLVGHDDAIIGLADVDCELRIVYSKNKIIDDLIEDGMPPEDAEEYFQFNIAGVKTEGNMAIYVEEVVEE